MPGLRRGRTDPAPGAVRGYRFPGRTTRRRLPRARCPPRGDPGRAATGGRDSCRTTGRTPGCRREDRARASDGEGSYRCSADESRSARCATGRARTQAPCSGSTVGRSGVIGGLFGIRALFTRRNLVLLGEPGTQIDQAAPVTAERAECGLLGPLHRPAAGWTFHHRGHGRPITRSRSGGTARPSRRARADSWCPPTAESGWCIGVGCR